MDVAFVGVFLIFYIGFIAAIYILQFFGLYRMAKHAGIPNAWLAFVPIGGSYVVGLLADRAAYTYTGRTKRLAFWNVLLCGIPLLGFVLMMILAVADAEFGATVGLSFFVLFGGVIAATVVFFYSIYYIFKDYAPDNAVLYTLLGIVLGIYWIFFLVVMNHVPVSVTGFKAYPYGRPRYDKLHQWQDPYQDGYGPQNPYGPQGGAPYGQPQYPGQPPYQGQYPPPPQEQPGYYPPPHDFSGGYTPGQPSREKQFYYPQSKDPSGSDASPAPQEQEKKRDDKGPEL